MKHIAFAAAAATAAALLAVAPAYAAGCMLQPLGSLAMTISPDGTLAVPARLGVRDYTMALELGTADSAVGQDVARDLHLPLAPLDVSLTYRGMLVGKQVTLPSLTLGAQTGTYLSVLAVPDVSLPPGTVGVLGSRLMSNADVDLDFHDGKVNLFSPVHCPGGVVYWSDSAAVVPFDIDELGHIVFHMTLDGQDVSVSFARGAANSIRKAAAYRIFGRDADRKLAMAHPFQVLEIGGISIGHPAIAVRDDAYDRACSGSDQEIGCASRTDVELGLSTLRAMHIYVAFGEKKLYITAADAHK